MMTKNPAAQAANSHSVRLRHRLTAVREMSHRLLNLAERGGPAS
jgi:hypothetical protein